MSAPIVVFLAEDNNGDVLLVRRALRTHQLDGELLVAQHGGEVTSLLERIGNDIPAPDVLILDLNLPRMDGPELFERVRAHPLCSQTPLIVVTSSDSPRDHEWTSAFNVAYYFRKPSSLDEFLTLGAVVKSITSKPAA